MRKRQMGLKGPIRGRRGFPPLGHVPREGPTPLAGAPPLPRGLVPHGGGEEVSTPPLPI